MPKTISPHGWVVHVASLSVLALACSWPGPALMEASIPYCTLDENIRICIAESQYELAELVPYTIMNEGTDTIYTDPCGGMMVGRRTPGDEWNPTFGVIRTCGDRSRISEWWTPIPPDSVVTDSAFAVNSSAYPGEWRILVTLLDSDARPIREEPFATPVFIVDP